MDRDTQQIKTTPMTIKSVIRSAAFVQGFKDVQAGKPFDYDFGGRDTSKQWAYERGRQFGLLYAGELKLGNKIRWGAQIELAYAFNTRGII